MAVLEQAIQEKELEQLVSLAETVSEKIEWLKDEYSVNKYQKTSYGKITIMIFIFILISIFVITTLALNDAYKKASLKIMSPKNLVDMTNTFDTNFVWIMTGIIITSVIFVLTHQMNYSNKHRNFIRTQVAQEQKILTELLNMIHSYKELAYHDMSVVSRAVFEMRLSRIAFSVDGHKE